MIVFCDTSALVKLYVVEAERAAVKGLVAVVAVCRIAWAEAFAAFSRRAREGPADAAAIEDARRALWPELLVLEVTQPVVEQTGEFANTFALRAYGTVQLAAAHRAMAVAQEPLVFACFDACLNKASQVLGMEALRSVTGNQAPAVPAARGITV